MLLLPMRFRSFEQTGVMKTFFLAITLIVPLFWGCQTQKTTSDTHDYLRWVGDIQHNNKIDATDFKVCNGEDDVLQYFNVGQGPIYLKEKSEIIETFKSKYKPIRNKKENGLIRIRFIVNCEGKAGRFRILQSDYDYKEKEFDPETVSQLLSITKGIEKWQILSRKEIPVDYYMYLIFKIVDGQLIEILP